MDNHKEILKVLKFYADKRNYQFNQDSHAIYDTKIEEDGGKMASELLKKLSQKKTM